MNSNLNSVYPLSYSTFLNDIQRFKKSGGPNSDSFNFFDSPSHKYYKIFFYFGTKSENFTSNMSDIIEYSGLLAPTWIYESKHFKELSSLGYYRDKYFVDEPIPSSESWNIDTSYTDFTDFEYFRDLASFYGLNVSKITGYQENYSGNLDIKTAGKLHFKLTFENGMLTSDSFLDDSDKELNSVYYYLKTYVQKREKEIKKYNEYLKKINDYNNTAAKFNANKYYLFNTAWSYLKLQGFDDKAFQLQRFIELLSNISIESPWYFSGVTGISEALNRKCASADGAKMDLGMRSKITITCLPDAFDNRIGTLLDLYRSVVFDWNNKREIIPANLRKFDMAIYVFEAPDQRWHKEERNDLTKIADKWTEAYNDSIGNTLKSIFPNAINDNEQSNYNKDCATLIAESEDSNFLASHKLIEFHDCEINYNSSTSAWAALDNKTGFTPQYNIEISFADCYEISYNDLLQEYNGDTMYFLSDIPGLYEKQRELLNKPL